MRPSNRYPLSTAASLVSVPNPAGPTPSPIPASNSVRRVVTLTTETSVGLHPASPPPSPAASATATVVVRSLILASGTRRSCRSCPSFVLPPSPASPVAAAPARRPQGYDLLPLDLLQLPPSSVLRHRPRLACRPHPPPLTQPRSSALLAVVFTGHSSCIICRTGREAKVKEEESEEDGGPYEVNRIFVLQ